MKKLVKLASVSRVAPGLRGTIDIPIGPTYERVILVFTAAAGLDALDIGRTDVLINGNPIQTFKDGQRIIDLNTYYAREADIVTAARMELAIHFNRAELADNIWRNAAGIGTANVATFSIEFDVASGAPADIACVAYAQVDPTRQNLGIFTRIREFPANAVSAGVYEHDKLPRGAWYSAVHMFKADISNTEVEANGVKIIDATKAVGERFQKGAQPRARVPLTAKATHVDFITDGNLTDSLPTAGLQDFRVKATCGSNGAFDIVTETLDTLTA